MINQTYTLTEACNKANVCEMTLRRAIRAGHLNFSKSKGRIWISDADLKAYLTQLYIPQLKTLGFLLQDQEHTA